MPKHHVIPLNLTQRQLHLQVIEGPGAVERTESTTVTAAEASHCISWLFFTTFRYHTELPFF